MFVASAAAAARDVGDAGHVEVLDEEEELLLLVERETQLAHLALEVVDLFGRLHEVGVVLVDALLDLLGRLLAVAVELVLDLDKTRGVDALGRHALHERVHVEALALELVEVDRDRVGHRRCHIARRRRGRHSTSTLLLLQTRRAPQKRMTAPITVLAVFDNDGDGGDEEKQKQKTTKKED